MTLTFAPEKQALELHEQKHTRISWNNMCGLNSALTQTCFQNKSHEFDLTFF